MRVNALKEETKSKCHSDGRNNTGQLKLHLNRVHQRGHRWATCLDDKVGGFAVERVSHCVQIPQAAEGVCHLQQRPLRVMPKAPEQLFW